MEATLIVGSLVVGAPTAFVLVWSLNRLKSKLTKALALIAYVMSVMPAVGLAGQWLEAFDFSNGSLAIATLNFAVVAIIPLMIGTLAGLLQGVVINGVVSLFH